MTAQQSSTDRPVRWRGVNHLALVTDDMDATTRFYHGVLGARLSATIGTPTFRHYFFDFGAGSTIAFFEYRDQELAKYAKPAGIFDPRAVQFDHLAFGVADEGALLELRSRLKAADCEVTDVVDHGFIRSIYFTDPNGISLEASCWLTDPTGRTDLDYDDSSFFHDDDPVPAVRELENGGLLTTPRTRLVHGPTINPDDWTSA